MNVVRQVSHTAEGDQEKSMHLHHDFHKLSKVFMTDESVNRIVIKQEFIKLSINRSDEKHSGL